MLSCRISALIRMCAEPVAPVCVNICNIKRQVSMSKTYLQVHRRMLAKVVISIASKPPDRSCQTKSSLQRAIADVWTALQPSADLDLDSTLALDDDWGPCLGAVTSTTPSELSEGRHSRSYLDCCSVLAFAAVGMLTPSPSKRRCINRRPAFSVCA